MKCLVLFPPQSMPENPYLSTPIIKGILNANGHDTDVMDINLSFYNYILNPEFIKKTLNRADIMWKLFRILMQLSKSGQNLPT